MPKLSLVIPAYNESESLPALVSQMAIFQNHDVEVIIVDNGSSDSTPEVLNKLASKVSFLTYERIEVNKGYGAGILHGLDKATGDILAWTHADLQTDPSDVLKAYNIFVRQGKNSIIVKGKRSCRPLLSTILTYSMQIFASVILKMKLDDINAQPKMFHREIYQDIKASEPPKDFSLDLFLLYWANIKSFQIIDFPVTFDRRIYGDATGGGGGIKSIIKISLRTFKFIIKIRKKYLGP